MIPEKPTTPAASRVAAEKALRWNTGCRWLESWRDDRFEATIDFTAQSIAVAAGMGIVVCVVVVVLVARAGDAPRALAFGALWAFAVFVGTFAWIRSRTRNRARIVVTADRITATFVETAWVETRQVREIQPFETQVQASEDPLTHSVRIRAGDREVTLVPSTTETLARRRAERLSEVIRSFQSGPYRGGG